MTAMWCRLAGTSFQQAGSSLKTEPAGLHQQ